MKLFKEKIRLCHEAYYAEDYLACSQFLTEAYTYWYDRYSELPLPETAMLNGLLVIEGLLELPEFEPTPYIQNIITTERQTLTQTVPKRIRHSLQAFRGLAHDLLVVIRYLDEYTGALGQSYRPSITVGIDAAGQYSFYENIYQTDDEARKWAEASQKAS